MSGAPKLYGKGDCTYCNTISGSRQYNGKLREYRTHDGHTIPSVDQSTGLRLSRTVDFFADTGEVFRGAEVTHGKRAHDAIVNATNLIAFTVKSTGLKRYVLVQDDDTVASFARNLNSSPNMSISEIIEDISLIENIDSIDKILELLSSRIPPKRLEHVVHRIIRNPKIARLVKERQNYICELCKRPPFIQKSGKPYAEADHINPLGGNYRGLDTASNMRCLCAQCHAIITHGSGQEIDKIVSL